MPGTEQQHGLSVASRREGPARGGKFAAAAPGVLARTAMRGALCANGPRLLLPGRRSSDEGQRVSRMGAHLCRNPNVLLGWGLAMGLRLPKLLLYLVRGGERSGSRASTLLKGLACEHHGPGFEGPPEARLRCNGTHLAPPSPLAAPSALWCSVACGSWWARRSVPAALWRLHRCLAPA